jgi:glycerophosphoryl diester phosphodiesterase
MKILKFEDILKKFSCHAVMNIHLKTPSNDFDYDPKVMQKIIDLIRQYDCEKYVYFMSGNDKVLAMLQEMAPDLHRCVGAGDAPLALVERALKYGCQKIQIAKKLINGFEATKEQIQTMIDAAHEHGIVCNMFWSDDPVEAKEFLDMGIDTILTNEFLKMESVIKDRKKYKMM